MTNLAPGTASSQAYARRLIVLHWLAALLLAAAFATIELRVLFEKGSVPRETLKSVHFMIGMSILAVVLVRLVVRAMETAPPILPAPPAWQTGLSHALHALLYALMLAMPILGWLTLSAAGKEIPFGLPALIGENKDAAGWYKETHHLLSTVFYWVIGLHALAALVHHYVVKDNTLQRMLPGRG